MAYNTTGYQNMYGFQLLDELHNFFPELLYDSDQFPHEIIQWFRYRVSVLFPAYVREQNLYRLYSRNERHNNYAEWRRNTVPVNLQTPDRSTNTALPASPRRVVRTRNNDPLTERLFVSPVQDLMTILASTQLLNNPLIVPLYQDVPVVPTNAQIDAGSRVVHASTLAPDTLCTICQERVGEMGEWRTLHCGHHFHNNCIQRVFQDSVFCPVCRADIRNVSQR